MEAMHMKIWTNMYHIYRDLSRRLEYLIHRRSDSISASGASITRPSLNKTTLLVNSNEERRFFQGIKGHKYIFYNKWWLHPGNLEPGSTYIISLAAHNKLGFSKSARITVTLPQSQLSDTGGEREHVIEVLGPGIVHQRGLFSLNCGGKISIK